MGAFDALLAKAKAPPAEEPLMAPPDEEGDDPKRASVLPVADDLLAAIKSGDAGAVADALIAAHEACAGGEYDTESEEA
jgi:hypothetical protein